MSIEAYKLQEESKTLKKLVDEITQREHELVERSNIFKPEEPVTIFNIKSKIDDHKAIQYALKQEKDKNALLQKEKIKLVSSLKEKDDVIFSQAKEFQTQQLKLLETEKQLCEEKERSNDLLGIKISNKELHNEMINRTKKKNHLFDLLIQTIVKHLTELSKRCPSFIRDLINHGILSDKDLDNKIDKELDTIDRDIK